MKSLRLAKCIAINGVSNENKTNKNEMYKSLEMTSKGHAWFSTLLFFIRCFVFLLFFFVISHSVFYFNSFSTVSHMPRLFVSRLYVYFFRFFLFFLLFFFRFFCFVRFFSVCHVNFTWAPGTTRLCTHKCDETNADWLPRCLIITIIKFYLCWSFALEYIRTKTNRFGHFDVYCN